MRGLINDLLDYSRLSYLNSPFQPTNLNEVLKQVISDFEVRITEQGASIHADELGTIDAIPLQMNQLFLNLLGNALKFGKKDTPVVITVKGNKLAEEKKAAFPSLLPGREYYEIVLSDNGIGFDPAFTDKIFTLFRRLNDRADYAGHGIGLSICSKVVSLHQGMIYADSLINVGSAFTVILPYSQD